jgi:hypothetical protein
MARPSALENHGAGTHELDLDPIGVRVDPGGLRIEGESRLLGGEHDRGP